MEWSAQSLVDFSYLPAINDLLENTLFLGRDPGLGDISLDIDLPSSVDSLETLSTLDLDHTDL